ncbi:peroxidase [Ranunculus cassubicifolius]
MKLHFYKDSCPQAEIIVKNAMEQEFKKDPTVAAALLRLNFHDCMVRGCDASILLDSRGENIAEKEAPPNLSLRGFQAIDRIKAKVEAKCRGIVSCADVLALATRDGVSLSGGSSYPIPTGRRDGLISSMSDVHIPGPSKPLDFVLNAFQTIGLNLDDLTTLLGAHSVGFCHCGFFGDRLYNFKGSGRPDPDMDPHTVTMLKQKCPRTAVFNLSTDPTVFMTPTTNTPFKLDSSFYNGVLNGGAVLQLDQGLGFTQLTRFLATKYTQQPNLFRRKFARAMIKMGNAGVLEGKQGEVRLNCRRVNGKKH